MNNVTVTSKPDEQVEQLVECYALTPADRKAYLGHGGLSRVARRTRRTKGHVSQVNREQRRDPVVERAIVRLIVARHPRLREHEIWPHHPHHHHTPHEERS